MKKITSEIIDAIKASSNILICGHIRPDGDCVSSALAMRRFCEKLGKNAVAVCDADKPYTFSFLPDYDKFCVYENIHYDLFIGVDCANASRLGIFKAVLDGAENSIDIDHHFTNERYGKINHIDASAASTCSILLELFDGTGLIDNASAQMLYTGLSTDTGHFMHANTDARVFKAAAHLCEYGLDIGALNHSIYCNKRIERIRLSGRVMNSIKLFGGGKIALMSISLDDLGETCCKIEDTEGLIDYATEIGGVQISISMCEQEGGMYRISFRSVSTDVAAVAETFGGGGHKLASGCIIYGTAADVADRVVKAAAAALGVSV